MLWPKVVGQSGTARAAPVLVTRPPKTISTPVAAAVSTASRCVRLTPVHLRQWPRVSVPRARAAARAGACHCGQVVLGRLGIAVLVRPAVDVRHRRPRSCRAAAARAPSTRACSRCQGSAAAFGPPNRTGRSSTTKRICAAPSTKRADRHEHVHRLQVLRGTRTASGCRSAACGRRMPEDVHREERAVEEDEREDRSGPCPSVSFIIRPNIFGNQK